MRGGGDSSVLEAAAHPPGPALRTQLPIPPQLAPIGPPCWGGGGGRVASAHAAAAPAATAAAAFSIATAAAAAIGAHDRRAPVCGGRGCGDARRRSHRSRRFNPGGYGCPSSKKGALLPKWWPAGDNAPPATEVAAEAVASAGPARRPWAVPSSPYSISRPPLMRVTACACLCRPRACRVEGIPKSLRSRGVCKLASAKPPQRL